MPQITEQTITKTSRKTTFLVWHENEHDVRCIDEKGDGSEVSFDPQFIIDCVGKEVALREGTQKIGKMAVDVFHYVDAWVSKRADLLKEGWFTDLRGEFTLVLVTKEMRMNSKLESQISQLNIHLATTKKLQGFPLDVMLLPPLCDESMLECPINSPTEIYQNVRDKR